MPLKRFTALLLLLVLLSGLFACSPKETEKNAETLPAAVSNVTESAGTFLTDGAGRAIAIPENGAEEKIASVYGTAVPFLVALELSDQVVAVNVKSNFWKKAVPGLNAAGTIGKGVVDMEGLAASGATVLIHRSQDRDTVEAVENLGVDVVCIRAESMEQIYATLRLLGAYFGKTERAETVISWMDGKFAKIDEIVAGIPKEERVTALCMGGELGRVAAGDMIQSWMIEKAGGIAVSAETQNNANWLNVGAETVFTWNPEYIFCTSSASLDYTVEELLADPTWCAVKAVEREQVYQIPSVLDTWDMPGIADVICTFWMLYRMYPSYFSAEQLDAEINDYYRFMFGRLFDEDYLGYTLE